MEIKTKFNPGDKVWTIIDGKAKETAVESIHIFKDGVSYAVNKADKHCYVQHPESECFPTKEALIAYISGDGNENM